MQTKFRPFINKHLDAEIAQYGFLPLQRLTDIHLHSNLARGIEPNSNIFYIYIFVSVAFFIIFIACINFMNLATARSLDRAREVGIRKVLGALRSQLVAYFLSEAFIFALIAFCFAIGLMEIFLPEFNILVGQSLHLNDSNIFLGFFIITPEQTIVIPRISNVIKDDYFTFKNEISAFPGVVGVSASMEEPSREIRDTAPIYAEGMKEGKDTIVMDFLPVDLNFFDFMEIELVAGKKFPASFLRTKPFPFFQEWQDVIDFVNGQNRHYILNEMAVKAVGWAKPEDALGKQFSWSNGYVNLERGPIIGVVKDFHFTSLRHKIEPVVMIYEPAFLSAILIKIHPRNMAATLAQVEKKWNEIYPEYPFDYTFVDKLFEQLYLSEQRQTQVLGLFSGIAIFVAFMGIFGLAAFTAQNRTKEIGIRKVLGATIPGITLMFSKEFIQYVFLAGVIATPISWFIMQRWLTNFAYRIDIDWWVFALAGGLALVIALLTVSTQAIKAALANPIETLRYE